MIGKTVSHYRILENLGSGGMGVVYKAQDLKLDRPVALKFLPPDLTRDPDAKQRFVHEAKAASALQHNNICVVHDIDETDDGQTFISMEYLEGETLKKKIERRPLKIEDAINIAVQVAQGLTKAHEHGIIHRDIKPANILITADGVVKIVDFGLAKLSGRTRLTKTGSTLGTAAYMSPEQGRGQPADHRTDIWSLGVVLYEMLSGWLPFEAEYENALVYSILNVDPEPVTGLRTGVPMELERIVRKCLQKAPPERYQHADELIVDLKALSRQPSVEEKRALKEPVTVPRRRRAIIYALISAILVGIVGVTVWLVRGGGHRQRSGAEIKSIAVLPFPTLGTGEEARMFADGIHGEILNRLTRIKGLKVKAQTSVMQYRDTKKRISEIGKELGVDFCMEGSIQRAGDRVMVQAQVIDAESENHVWGETYDRQLKDIFAIEKEIAQNIASALNASLTAREQSLMESRPTESVEAYDYFLKGNYWWTTGASLEENQRALEMYAKAVEIDTNFAAAYAAIVTVECALLSYEQKRSGERIENARHALERAIALNPNFPDVHLASADFYLNAKPNVARARSEYEKAITDAPTKSGALSSYGWFLHLQNQDTEGHQFFKRAYESDNTAFHAATLTQSYFYHRDFEQAQRWNEITILHDPRMVHWSRDIPLHGLGDTARFREICQKEPVDPRAVFGSWRYYPPWQFILELYARNYPAAMKHANDAQILYWPLSWSGSDLSKAFLYRIMGEKRNSEAMASEAVARYTRESELKPDVAAWSLGAALAFALSGEGDAALRAIERTRQIQSPLDGYNKSELEAAFATIHLVLGEHDLTIQELEHALSVPSPLTKARLRLDPIYDPLRSNPRFQALLVKDERIPVQ